MRCLIAGNFNVLTQNTSITLGLEVSGFDGDVKASYTGGGTIPVVWTFQLVAKK